MHTAFWDRPAGRVRPSIPRRRPRGTPGSCVPLHAPPQPAGAACSQAARGGARSGQAPLRGGLVVVVVHAGADERVESAGGRIEPR